MSANLSDRRKNRRRYKSVSLSQARPMDIDDAIGKNFELPPLAMKEVKVLLTLACVGVTSLLCVIGLIIYWGY